MAVSISKKISHSLWRSKRAFLGLIVLFVVTLTSIFAPFLAPHDPLQQDLAIRLKPPGWSTENSKFFLGTDHLGRDILSRIIFGSRISLIVGLCALFIGAGLGIGAGLISGYYSGKIDSIIMRLADIQLALPFILLIIAVVAVLGPSLKNIVIVIGVTSWVNYARIIRAEVLSLREKEFVTAAKAMGSSNFKIIFFHILPNVAASSIVIATLEIARIILMEAGLSFLGVGVPPPTPTWGGILADGRVYLFSSWWLATFPGLALMVTVLGVNVVGDWLRDFLVQ